ncbi:MAG: hypothetical protein PHD32_07390 [Eubacteriales bacterium]|nr:hypothetical protein [Eubacteriales bacterium]
MNIWTVAISAGISAVISALVGIVLRSTIEKSLTEAKAEAEKRRQRKVEYETLHKAWHHAVGRMLYHLAMRCEGRDTNGDIPKAYAKIEQIEARQKELDQRTAAEIQEE